MRPLPWQPRPDPARRRRTIMRRLRSALRSASQPRRRRRSEPRQRAWWWPVICNADGYDDLAIATALEPRHDRAADCRRSCESRQTRARDDADRALACGKATGNAVAIADLDRTINLDIVVAAAGGAPNRVFLNDAGSYIASTVANATLNKAAAPSRSAATPATALVPRSRRSPARKVSRCY